jgi:hypothetical protein
VEPFIGQIVAAIHDAFAIAIASTFWISIGAAALAAILVLFLKAVPAPGSRAPVLLEPEPTS